MTWRKHTGGTHGAPAVDVNRLPGLLHIDVKPVERGAAHNTQWETTASSLDPSSTSIPLHSPGPTG
ncbi:hypothetical protein EYF80_043774 [Liparis tanakae]|uniref:Uncharacterized protein n=1 Tax=Liparis tanakae TaxID=230148 RepID=A0A4Z2FXJ0_9TELE|nr:hypothetical protein EYF80_043774 [Liparis tanakae]